MFYAQELRCVVMKEDEDRDSDRELDLFIREI